MGADNTLHISKWRARDKKISAKTKLKLRDKVRDFNAKLALDNIQAKKYNCQDMVTTMVRCLCQN